MNDIQAIGGHALVGDNNGIVLVALFLEGPSFESIIEIVEGDLTTESLIIRIVEGTLRTNGDGPPAVMIFTEFVAGNQEVLTTAAIPVTNRCPSEFAFEDGVRNFQIISTFEDNRTTVIVTEEQTVQRSVIGSRVNDISTVIGGGRMCLPTELCAT
ncbi:hypothetical protein V6x_13180 [Gimesia chilikensis]|uniref:Uncharacterized protein n=1 Tax=Gimesia chilikensis TaxID=2605989 RepID=A0A517W8P6_9PLAN|nr:hypothetical protein V6x_13180 [Gimesia chilikensis]